MKRVLKGLPFLISAILIICFVFRHPGIQLPLPAQKNKVTTQEEITASIVNKKETAPKRKNTTHEVQEIQTIDGLLTALTSKNPTVIMGTMDHCHFCKRAQPIFTSYPEQFPNIGFFTANGPKTNMGQLVYKETNSKVAIRGYPAFLFIKDGKIQDHLLGTNIEKLESKLQSL